MSKPGETDYGKGSFPRTWNSDKFRDNFDAINWSKPEWPDFIGAGFEPAPKEFSAFQPGGCVLEKPNTKNENNQQQ